MLFLVNRRITETAGEWNELLQLNQDGEYFCRVVAASEYVKFVPNAKCYYRIGNLTSISNKKSNKSLESLTLSNNLCVDHLLNLEDNQFTREAGLIFLQRFLSGIYYEEDEFEAIKIIKKRIKDLGGNIPERNESKKFRLIRKILGLKSARKLKSYLWNLEIIIRKYLEKIIIIYKN